MAPEHFPRGMKTTADIKQFFKDEGINRFQYVVDGVLYDYIRLASGPPAFVLIEDNNRGTIFDLDDLISIVFQVYLQGTGIQYL